MGPVPGAGAGPPGPGGGGGQSGPVGGPPKHGGGPPGPEKFGSEPSGQVHCARALCTIRSSSIKQATTAQLKLRPVLRGGAIRHCTSPYVCGLHGLRCNLTASGGTDLIAAAPRCCFNQGGKVATRARARGAASKKCAYLLTLKKNALNRKSLQITVVIRVLRPGFDTNPGPTVY